ncbi:hypothetical protein HZC21_05165 [Candidatus Peregrinibacteria bacterium]|nr:hypothetical protein [Candidatus Peregrinibacteria bacterium]
MNKLPLAVAAALCFGACTPQQPTAEEQRQEACEQARGAVRSELDKLFSVYDACLNGRGHILQARERFCFDPSFDNAVTDLQYKCGGSMGDGNDTRCLSVAVRDCNKAMEERKPAIDKCKSTMAAATEFSQTMNTAGQANADPVSQADKLVVGLDMDCVNNPGMPTEGLKNEAAVTALKIAQEARDKVVQKMVLDHLGRPERGVEKGN